MVFMTILVDNPDEISVMPPNKKVRLSEPVQEQPAQHMPVQKPEEIEIIHLDKGKFWTWSLYFLNAHFRSNVILL